MHCRQALRTVIDTYGVETWREMVQELLGSSGARKRASAQELCVQGKRWDDYRDRHHNARRYEALDGRRRTLPRP